MVPYYLKPRKFKVEIGQEKSITRHLDSSVPQGSIQGASLFITYASTLHDQIENLILSGFVDDHSVRKMFKLTRLDHKDELDIVEIIQKAMLDIKAWMDQVCLKMNKSKTEFIYFGGNRQLEKCKRHKIDVDGEDIQRVKLTRYLGAYLDSSLNFKEYIKTKCKQP